MEMVHVYHKPILPSQDIYLTVWEGRVIARQFCNTANGYDTSSAESAALMIGATIDQVVAAGYRQHEEYPKAQYDWYSARPDRDMLSDLIDEDGYFRKASRT